MSPVRETIYTKKAGVWLLMSPEETKRAKPTDIRSFLFNVPYVKPLNPTSSARLFRWSAPTGDRIDAAHRQQIMDRAHRR
jgi:hypothetical protein